MKIYIITGQTATGKTRLAYKYAKKNNGELINCDSRQIYKKLNIITGKELIPGVKIWLYDIVDPKAHFSSFDFVQHALPLIKKILKEGKTPVIVGGTYLYIKHLLYGFETENIRPDWKLRKKLNNKSVAELQTILISVNNRAIEKLNNSDRNNPQRLIRKIEILMSNRTVPRPSLTPSRWKLVGNKIKFIGLRFKDKNKLRKKIEKRIVERIKLGAIDEVKKLLSQGYKETDPGLKTIGYQQIIKYLKGELTYQESLNEWLNKEVQYAKRQYIFMMQDSTIVWKTV